MPSSEGLVPRITTVLDRADRLGMWKVRWGFGRMSYRVEPGLYAVGTPDRESEVLVTANYRMTFDLLRRSLEGLNCWILVLDTNGVNVWCAAGKGSFGTRELADRIGSTGLERVVSHRRLILPQLGAPGVSGHDIRHRTGFRVIYGPVEAADVPAFLEAGLEATPAMRIKKFPLVQRAVLVPMELVPASKWVLIISVILAALAGLAGPGPFFADAWRYGSRAFAYVALGTFAGAVITPVMLPWVPGRAFALKGLVAGAAVALPLYLAGALRGLEGAAWALAVMTFSSFLAMNFTGSTTYTSLSGVRREMKFAVPAQAGACAIALVLWLGALLTSGGSP